MNNARAKGRVIVVMGVSGTGKTTVGHILAQRLNGLFYDGDSFQPAENKRKMARGLPLTDEDRWPWLLEIRSFTDMMRAQTDKTIVIACSALKKSYREMLTQGKSKVIFVYLRGREDVLQLRLRARSSHFFDPALLNSQFEALEPPEESEAICVDVSRSVEEIVGHALEKISILRHGYPL
eukprot:gb/GECG01002408.1/.p1 GENE.gb/GECG01002408.1/~~gb/GECG01002408.1/.p1  ORF type:complete len:180 (+),score=17.43 gb/GECG01002408.1/:1-540(+)